MNTIPRKLGRYVIIREIGRGAMGVVYKAHDPVIEREVAIKAIHLNFQVTDEEKELYLSRFYREAKAAGKLNHPGIVTIYDVDEDKEQSIPFIVMEFLDGTNLQEFTSAGTRLPVEHIRSVIMQMADALSYAHEHSIVHRDVKSANIIILPDMKAKITDFGIARLPSSDLTRSGQFIGTPNYMSPEQIEGKTQVDGRSDLFSLGVIFYMLLTGERPFLGDSFNTVAYKIVNIDPLPPSAINPEVPAGYNRILMRMLAKDPAARYASGRELFEDLKSLHPSESVPHPGSDATRLTLPPRVNNTRNEAPAKENSGTERELIASSQTVTLFDTPIKRKIVYVTVGSILAVLLTAGIFLYKSSSPDSVVSSAPQAVPLHIPDAQPKTDQNDAIRSRWNLAMNYYKNGLYDKSLEEIHEILAMDPENAEARKYLETITKEKEAKASAAKPPVITSVSPAAAKAPAPKIVNRKKTAKRVGPMAGPAIPKIPVDFVLEHSFPSGLLNIYLENKLLYTAELHATKKKILLFTSYQGKINGTLELPPGPSVLQVQVVCKELGVSTVKETTVDLKDGDHRTLKIRYMKPSKQLDIKWS